MKPNLSLLHLHSQPTALHHKEFPGECPHEKLSLSTCRGLTRSSDWTPTDGKQKKIKSLPLRKPQAAYTCNTMNSRCKPPTSKYHYTAESSLHQREPFKYSAIWCIKFKPSVGESKPLEGLCLKARANLIVCLSASNLLRLTEIFPSRIRDNSWSDDCHDESLSLSCWVPPLLPLSASL